MRSAPETRRQQTLARQPHEKPIQKEAGVLRLIHQYGKIPRVELAKLTGSSPAAVTSIARKLIAKRLVIESGRGSTHFGRKPVLLSVRDDAAYLIGVDIGSYFLRVVIADMNGHVICKLRQETNLQDGREAITQRTFRAIRQAIEQSRIPIIAIRGVGVGHSGVIDITRGVVLSLPRPGQMLEWKNVPLKSIFEQEFGIPCVLEDSVRTRATAEKYYGLGAKLNDFIYIDVGMGIGAAIFINGKIYRGAGGNAGEFGHMTVDERGPRCSCGNNGCVEVLASCGPIIRAAREAIEKGVDSKVRELAQGELKRINIEIIAQAAQENDSLAYRILDDAVSHIAVALADVVNLLNPKVVIFGGALFQAAPRLLLEALKRPLKQRALEKSAGDVQFEVSTLGSEAGALGAARLMSEKVLEILREEN